MSAGVHVAGVEDAAVVALLGRITFSETFGSLFASVPDRDLAHATRARPYGRI